MTWLCNLYCCLLPTSIIDMADERTKKSKCANRLKVFRLGSQSTPQSRSNSPPPFVAPEPKFSNRLKKVFRLGSQTRSTPQSRSNTPLPSVAAPSAIPSPPIMAVAPLVSSPPSVDTLAPVPPPPAITVPPVDRMLPADLVSPTDPVPPVNLAPTITMTPEEAAKLRAKYTHSRILIIGRANAGKTTLLKRVCNTLEDPVYNRVSYQLRLISPYHFVRQIKPTDEVPAPWSLWISLIMKLIWCHSEGSTTSVMDLPSRATRGSSSTILLDLRLGASTNSRPWCLSLRRRRRPGK